MHAPTHTNGHTPSTAPGAGLPPGPDTKPPPRDGGRDPHGRFSEGNAGGPGNPFARRVAALRSALVASVTEQDLEEVAAELLRQAKEGNLAAARLLLSYAVGKPAPAVDPDTLDQQEWEQYRRLPDPAPEMLAAPGRLTLPLGLDYMRSVLPKLAESQRGMVLDGLNKMEAKDRAKAAAREKRQRLRQGHAKAAPTVQPEREAPAARDEEALRRLGQLLNLATPSANGLGEWADRPTPPSANGWADVRR